MSAARSQGFARPLTRRAFVFGASLAAGGLVMGLPPALSWSEPTGRVGARTTSEVTVWVAIEPDDTAGTSASRDRRWARVSRRPCRCWWLKSLIAIRCACALTSLKRPRT
jgi:hypothetical protein